MTKRWLIRALCMLPVVLCLAGWGWSGWYHGQIFCENTHRWIQLATVQGAIDLWGGWDSRVRDRYAAHVGRDGPVMFWPELDRDSTCFLGFRWKLVLFGGPGGPRGNAYCLTIPYWFPLLVSALLLLGAWRKTRSRPDPATAFPVVMKDAGGTMNEER